MRIIFVGGVHGVGKTTACTRAAKLLGLNCYSSGEVIQSEKAEMVLTTDKSVFDIKGNQSLLIQGLCRRCKNQDKTILLDGHFCLLKSDGAFQEISVDVFGALNLQGIVVFQDVPLAISQRLIDRDKIFLDSNVLENLQKLELAQAHLVASNLNIPIRILKAFDEREFLETISKWINPSN